MAAVAAILVCIGIVLYLNLRSSTVLVTVCVESRCSGITNYNECVKKKSAKIIRSTKQSPNVTSSDDKKTLEANCRALNAYPVYDKIGSVNGYPLVECSTDKIE